MGNYEKVLGDFTVAIELNPRGKYYSARAMTYDELGDTISAATDNACALMSSIE